MNEQKIPLAIVLLAGLLVVSSSVSSLAQRKKPEAHKPVAKTSAPQAKLIGEFEDWQALTYKEKSGETCYVASLPKKSEGHQSKPGETNILVTHWPSQKSYGVVSVAAGYDYKKESDVEVTVGTDKFKLYTQGKRAWSRDDAAVVKAFKAGKDAVVQGISAKGAKTKDTYSLSGFTKAYDAASKACGVKG